MENDHVTRLREGTVEKGVFDNRGTFKPKAPANLILPKPVNVPPPPTQNGQSTPKK